MRPAVLSPLQQKQQQLLHAKIPVIRSQYLKADRLLGSGSFATVYRVRLELPRSKSKSKSKAQPSPPESAPPHKKQPSSPTNKSTNNNNNNNKVEFFDSVNPDDRPVAEEWSSPAAPKELPADDANNNDDADSLSSFFSCATTVTTMTRSITSIHIPTLITQQLQVDDVENDDDDEGLGLDVEGSTVPLLSPHNPNSSGPPPPPPYYALKRLKGDILRKKNPVQLRRASRDLTQEATLLGRLPAHPHVIQLLGVSDHFWKATARSAQSSLKDAPSPSITIVRSKSDEEDYDDKSDKATLASDDAPPKTLHTEEDDDDNDSAASVCTYELISQQYLVLEHLEETLAHRLDRWGRHHPATAQHCTNYCATSFLPYWGRRRRRPRLHALEQSRIQQAGVVGLAQALQFLHRHRLIFRDLKPANIGYDSRGRVRIFDFGLAREMPRSPHNVGTTTTLSRVSSYVYHQPHPPDGEHSSPPPIVPNDAEELYRMTGRIGTLRYMAPEVASKSWYGQSADVYSFGMVVWEIAILQRPFERAETVEQLEEWVVEGTGGSAQPLPQHVQSPMLQNVLITCLSRHTRHRPPRLWDSIVTQLSQLAAETV